MGGKNFSLEASVPQYLSNFCDSDCKICSMRRSNRKLLRKELSSQEIKAQLEIICKIEKISSLMLLTGEYAAGRKRNRMLQKVTETAVLAFETGFSRVNIGILFGVADIDQDMEQLFAHYRLLKAMGGEVEISVPRVKGVNKGIKELSDEEYVDAVK